MQRPTAAQPIAQVFLKSGAMGLEASKPSAITLQLAMLRAHKFQCAKLSAYETPDQLKPPQIPKNKVGQK
eukprot:600531-Amphidinium_carterae.2